MIAVVIEMPMRDDRMIDPLQTGDVTNDIENAITVAAIVVWITRVDEDRLTGRRDDQIRRSAFHINEVHI